MYASAMKNGQAMHLRYAVLLPEQTQTTCQTPVHNNVVAMSKQHDGYKRPGVVLRATRVCGLKEFSAGAPSR